jgi:phenylalanyl-tRNA synthetase beta chain
MKASYRWLKEYLHIDITPQMVTERLTMIGHEVEETIDLGLGNNPIRIARVEKVEPHTNSDKLSVCTVNYGGETSATVVCGAPNVATGQIAVLALAGASLPGGLVLKRTKIRGVASEGMLCALDELGLGSDHSGILVLNEKDWKIGEGFDYLYDISLTPNRGDCLSIFGLARDLAATFGKKVYLPGNRPRETYESVDQAIDISIRCPDQCQRYCARVINGVKIGPSPQWLQLRLLSVGLRPINNVVDVTNLAMMEIGHPMHAFDLDRLRQKEILVRLAKDGEKMKLLDGSEIELASGLDMVITDGVGPIALAGVMGGHESEVTESTERLLLEAAYFEPKTIRRTARRHRMSTDASFRFERGADIEVLPRVLDHAASLILELAGGEVPRGFVDCHPKPIEQRTLLLRTDRAARLLGVEIPRTRVADLLTALNFEILRADRERLVIGVPSFRSDISREEDIYEEIARLQGFDNIPSTMPYMAANAQPMPQSLRLRREIQDHLIRLGFDEAVNLSFVSGECLADLGFDPTEALQLLNPLSREQAVMRTDLAPSMLRTVVYNLNRGNTNLRLFETSRTYHFGDMATPYVETEALVLGMIGSTETSWRGEKRREFDFFDMKGVVESLLHDIGIASWRWEAGGPDFLHAKRRVKLYIDDKHVGWLGELSPTIRQKKDIAGRFLMAEIALDPICELGMARRVFREIPRYPAIERDLALVVDRGTQAGMLESTIRASAGDLLESLAIFDHYEGNQVGEGKKSIGFRACYRHAERTLTDEEVDTVQKKVLNALTKQTGATLR